MREPQECCLEIREHFQCNRPNFSMKDLIYLANIAAEMLYDTQSERDMKRLTEMGIVSVCSIRPPSLMQTRRRQTLRLQYKV